MTNIQTVSYSIFAIEKEDLLILKNILANNILSMD